MHALLGTALVAASARRLNQWLERHRDACMDRTAERPLPAGRLGCREVLAFGELTGVLGFVYLAVAVNWLDGCRWAGLSWLLYVVVLHAAASPRAGRTRSSARWPAPCRC